MSATSVPVPVECVFSRHTTGIISNGKRSSIGPAKLNLGFVQFSGKGPPVCGVTSFYNYWYAVILPVIVCHAKWLRRRQVGLREKKKELRFKVQIVGGKSRGFRSLVRVEAGSRIHAGSRLEAGGQGRLYR